MVMTEKRQRKDIFFRLSRKNRLETVKLLAVDDIGLPVERMSGKYRWMGGIFGIFRRLFREKEDLQAVQDLQNALGSIEEAKNEKRTGHQEKLRGRRKTTGGKNPL